MTSELMAEVLSALKAVTERCDHWYSIDGGFHDLNILVARLEEVSDRRTCSAEAATTSGPSNLGYWAISGERILAMLKRVANGEDPDLVYAEEYANSDSWTS